MRPNLIGLDHLMIATRDLDEVRAAYRRLGFTVTPYRTNDPMGGGKTGGRGGNHLVVMTSPDPRFVNYLELAYADPAHAAPFMKELLGKPPGLAMLVHAGTELAALDASWQEAGMPECMLYEHDTTWTDPETAQVDRIHFRVLVPTAKQGPFAVNAYESDDLSHYLRESWRTHRNGARHWTEVAMVLPDLDEAAAYMEKVYGVSMPVSGGEICVTIGAQSFRAMSEERFAAIHSATDRARTDGSAAGTAIRIETSSLSDARSVFAEQGVAFTEHDGVVVVPAGEAAGVVLCFVEEGAAT